LLASFLILILAASAGHPPREETRYVYFLYPLAVIISLSTLLSVLEIFSAQPVAIGLTSVLAVGGFALSEDFRPQHLLHIDGPAQTFRFDVPPSMQSHLVIRDDYRALARWLQQHQAEGYPVINGVHGLDHYYPDIKYFFVDQHDSNFPDWSCRRGTVERWGNYPLLNSVDELTAKVAESSKAYLVVFGYDIDNIMLSLAALHPRIVTTEGNITVLELQG